TEAGVVAIVDWREPVVDARVPPPRRMLGVCSLADSMLPTTDTSSEKAGSRSLSSSGSIESRSSTDASSAFCVLRVLPASDSASTTLGSAGRNWLGAPVAPERVLLDEGLLYRDRLPPASDTLLPASERRPVKAVDRTGFLIDSVSRPDTDVWPLVSVDAPGRVERLLDSAYSDATEPSSLFAAWRDRNASNRLSDERMRR
ncbi:MAG TPA: hypothetical protein VGL01_21675, partial [Trinickia sp.]|uniref:hypothetical protein n=1 Tax=Trinickia sp. TaxID=2571163 RepID=UPI002F3F7E57